MAFWWFGPLTFRTRRGGRVTVGGLWLTLPAVGAWALATAWRPSPPPPSRPPLPPSLPAADVADAPLNVRQLEEGGDHTDGEWP